MRNRRRWLRRLRPRREGRGRGRRWAQRWTVLSRGGDLHRGEDTEVAVQFLRAVVAGLVRLFRDGGVADRRADTGTLLGQHARQTGRRGEALAAGRTDALAGRFHFRAGTLQRQRLPLAREFRDLLAAARFDLDGLVEEIVADVVIGHVGEGIEIF